MCLWYTCVSLVATCKFNRAIKILTEGARESATHSVSRAVMVSTNGKSKDDNKTLFSFGTEAINRVAATSESKMTAAAKHFTTRRLCNESSDELCVSGRNDNLSVTSPVPQPDIKDNCELCGLPDQATKGIVCKLCQGLIDDGLAEVTTVPADFLVLASMPC